jgi:trk system potassium uptake protein TrkA
MRIIIAGAGAVGAHLGQMLSQGKHDIVLLDPLEEKLRSIGSNIDLMTLTGSGTSISDLTNAGVKRSDLLISVAKHEETNITAAIIGKKLGAKKTIARIDNEEYLFPNNREHFLNLGIDYLIYPEKIAAREIIGLINRTGSTEIVDFSGGKLSLLVIKLEENAPIIDKTLVEITRDIERNEYRAVAITRNSKTIIPRGEDKFKPGDTVYVVTNKKESVDDIMEYSGKKHFEIRDVMIAGGSRIGKTAAKELGLNHNVKLIELDREKSYSLSNFLNNALVINGDTRDMKLLLDEGLPRMDAFIAVTGNSETNILSCLVAKRMGVKKTFAEVENMDYIHLAENMGIDTIVNKKLITASRIFRFTMSEELTNVKCLTGTDAEVMEFVAKPDSKITKGSLTQVGFPKDSIVGGVIRGDSSFIANGYTVIKPYDKVVVFALPSAIEKLGKYFN